MARWPGNDLDNDHDDNDGCQEREHGYVGQSAGVQADEEASCESQPQEAAPETEGGAHQSAGQERH